MPKQSSDNDEMPRRRRRGAQAVAIGAEEERGFLMRVLLHSPKDTVACGLAAAAVLAIVANALFLQAGRHPSPMFGTVVTLPPPSAASVANPLPRPRPAEASARVAVEPAPVEAKVETKPADAKSSDPMANLVLKTTGASAATAGVARPPAPIPSRAETTQTAGSKRIAAVQRALTAHGYGQLKPTGTISAETQAAISRFERDRKLPVTGQLSDRVMRELVVVVGHPVE